MPVLLTSTHSSNSYEELRVGETATLLASELTLSYAAVGILGAIAWDTFSNIMTGCRLFHKRPIGLPTVVYFLSRIAMLSAFSGIVDAYTAFNVDCNVLLHVSKWAFAFGLSSTALLLVFRARAIYNDHPWTANFFLVMWLGVIASSIVEAQKGNASNLTKFSGRCANQLDPEPLILVTTLVPMVNDILIFCAITFKLVRNVVHEGLTTKKRFVLSWFGCFLPSFSRTLLRDGQAYFLVTILVSSVAIGFFCFAPHSEFSILFVFINAGVAHLMACKIYRKTRLLDVHEYTSENVSSMGPMEFRVNSTTLSGQQSVMAIGDAEVDVSEEKVM